MEHIKVFYNGIPVLFSPEFANANGLKEGMNYDKIKILPLIYKHTDYLIDQIDLLFKEQGL